MFVFIEFGFLRIVYGSARVIGSLSKSASYVYILLELVIRAVARWTASFILRLCSRAWWSAL